MGEFVVYILKSACCLVLFYLFYRWLLSKETFFRFNRFALLGILAISSLLPFAELSTTEQPVDIAGQSTTIINELSIEDNKILGNESSVFVYICVSKPSRQNGRKVTRKYIRIAEKIKI